MTEKTEPGGATFEAHWQTHKAPEISTSKLAEARAFLGPLRRRMQQATEPMRVLDMGCGDGVHAAVLSEEGLGQHRYYGVDLSVNAVRLARSRMRTRGSTVTDFQAGNALSLPYRSGVFDAVFSYGVIAYTGKPEMALDEMVRVCKPTGLVGVWVYPKAGGLAGALFGLTRALCRRLGRRGAKMIVHAIVPFLPVLPVRSGVNLFNSTWPQCVEVIEVNLLPEVLEFYSAEDVLSWFSDRAITVDFVDSERPVAVWGTTARR